METQKDEATFLEGFHTSALELSGGYYIETWVDSECLSPDLRADAYEDCLW